MGKDREPFDFSDCLYRKITGEQMKKFVQFASVSFILMLLSACNGVAAVKDPALTETPIPNAAIATGTLLPFPASTPTNTLPLPQLSGFPYAAELNDALPRENLILARHFYSDTVGHIQGDENCYDIGIYEDDSYIVMSCLPSFVYPAPNGNLDANQSKYLHHWVGKFHSFEDPSIHGLLKFSGMGDSFPDYSERISMQALLEDLEWDAYGYVHQGGYPPVVFHARNVLSTRLNMWLDNSAILKFEAIDYPDSCLGAPEPEEICEQGVTRGFRIQFVVQGLLYEYHTDVFGYDIRTFGEPQPAPTQGPTG
jgi:hypothetical protein